MTLLPFALLSCSGGRPAAVPADVAKTVRLEDLPFAEYQPAPHNRPSAERPPTAIPLVGPWHRDQQNGRKGYSAPIPIRPRGLFFYRPEAGIRLLDTEHQNAEIPYAERGDGPILWSHDRDQISVWMTGDAPAAGRFALSYPLASEREAQLNHAHAGLSDAEFAWTTIQDGWDARRGLLLPAPGTAAWELDVPPAAELQFTAGLVEPELRDADPSDGAALSVTVVVDGAETEVFTGPLAPRSFRPERVDLSRFSGKHVKLVIRSDPAGSPVFDYVFLAEPVVASRKADPVRVVMVFVDTLRPDHLSLYGYDRDTSAALDGLASEAAVFEAAYTVAPWTLPSARSLVTGRQPEEYFEAEPLPALLGKQGFASAFFAGNVYLSTNFGMDRAWDLHRVGGLWPRADQPTDDALRWLEEHDGRDAIVQVHYMDAHLPYLEPSSYRHKYAGDADPTLGERFELGDVKRAGVDKNEAAQQYVRDRYDNNIRYATDQIARLVEVLDDNDILLIYADHGEEFWDHGKFEHGHSLFGELLHVPLVIRAPGVPAGRIREPVSLLDLAPTILELAGQPIPAELDGRSLVALTRGDADAKAAFDARDLGFGRPLYGMEHWGVLHDDHTWITSEGREGLYDLDLDPAEKTNLLLNDADDGGAPYRAALAGALGREVKAGYRLTPTTYKGRPELGTVAICSVPGGFSDVWPGGDPLMNSFALMQKIDDPAAIAKRLAEFQITDHAVPADAGGVEVCWPPGYFAGREVYVVPTRPLDEVGRQMVCSVYLGNAAGGKRATMTFPEKRVPGLGALRTPINKALFEQRQVLWQWGIGPVPADVGSIDGFDSEAAGMLKELGYLERDGTAPVPEGERRESPTPCEAPAVPLAPMSPPPAR